MKKVLIFLGAFSLLAVSCQKEVSSEEMGAVRTSALTNTSSTVKPSHAVSAKTLVQTLTYDRNGFKSFSNEALLDESPEIAAHLIASGDIIKNYIDDDQVVSFGVDAENRLYMNGDLLELPEGVYNEYTDCLRYWTNQGWGGMATLFCAYVIYVHVPLTR